MNTVLTKLASCTQVGVYKTKTIDFDPSATMQRAVSAQLDRRNADHHKISPIFSAKYTPQKEPGIRCQTAISVAHVA